MIPRIFDGGEAVIVAGGPSLKEFDFRQLADRNVIAINRAHKFLPRAKVLWWTDARYWRRAGASLRDHPARWKATGNLEYRLKELPRTGIEQYLFTGATGFDECPEHLRHGWNSTYAAMHLAAHLGAKSIILLGVDLQHVAGKVACDADKWRVSFNTLAPILAAKNIAVINGSPNSALTVWPRHSVEDALSR